MPKYMKGSGKDLVVHDEQNPTHNSMRYPGIVERYGYLVLHNFCPACNNYVTENVLLPLFVTLPLFKCALCVQGQHIIKMFNII